MHSVQRWSWRNLRREKGPRKDIQDPKASSSSKSWGRVLWREQVPVNRYQLPVMEIRSVALSSSQWHLITTRPPRHLMVPFSWTQWEANSSSSRFRVVWTHQPENTPTAEDQRRTPSRRRSTITGSRNHGSRLKWTLVISLRSTLIGKHPDLPS